MHVHGEGRVKNLHPSLVTKNHNVSKLQNKQQLAESISSNIKKKPHYILSEYTQFRTPLLGITFAHLFSVRCKAVDSQKLYPSLTANKHFPAACSDHGNLPLLDRLHAKMFTLSQMLCIPQYGDATLNILTSSAVASAGSDTSSIFSDIFSTSEVLENNKWHSCTSALSKRSPESGQIIQRFFSAIQEAFPASFLSHRQPLAT